MAYLFPTLLLSLLLCSSLSAGEKAPKTTGASFSFPLSPHRSITTKPSPITNLYSSLVSRKIQVPNPRTGPSISYNYKSTFKYSMALIVSLPIGTPPQAQQMILDTGSQLSWIQCHKKKVARKPPPPRTAPFDPSLSSSFSVLPCTNPLCKPRIPDFTLPTTCDQNRLCHYSYFYADGTLAEGNLVKEKFTFSKSQSTPPLILGCAEDSADGKGILGMNLGRLSFASQAKISKFSYCVPTRSTRPGFTPTGSFYLGENPNSSGFKYINILTFPESHRMPNMDPLAYTLPVDGIRIGGKKLNISAAVFRPDAGGAGQTMIDSGSEFTYLVDDAYSVMRAEIVILVGPKLKKRYVYGQVADMCFDSIHAMEIRRLIGDMVIEFEKGVEIVIGKENVLADVGSGVHCVGIGRSAMLGIASNIIGNVHQQNMWVEFDLKNRRVGFGKTDCSKVA